MSQRPGNKKTNTRKNRRSTGTNARPTAANRATETPRKTAEANTTTKSTSSSARPQGSRRNVRKEVAQSQAKKKQQMQMIIGAVAAAVLIALVFILINRPTGSGVKMNLDGVAQSNGPIVAAAGTPAAEPRPTDLSWATGSTIGDPNAPVTMHVFSDFQCHFCLQFHEQTLQKVIDDFVKPGKVKLVFHDFPRLGSDPTIAQANPDNPLPEIADPNNESSLAAQAAMCAGEQDQYMQMSDKLFGNYGGVQAGAFKMANLNRFADDLGLDMNAFKTCMSSGKYVPALADSVSQGQKNGITATPMFILDNGNGSPNVIQQTAEGYTLMKKQIELSIDSAP